MVLLVRFRVEWDAAPCIDDRLRTNGPAAVHAEGTNLGARAACIAVAAAGKRTSLLHLLVMTQIQCLQRRQVHVYAVGGVNEGEVLNGVKMTAAGCHTQRTVARAFHCIGAGMHSEGIRC